VLSNQQGVFHTPITPLNRKGEKVEFQQVQTGTDLLENLSTTLRKWQKKYKRITIIQKDEEKSEILTRHLNDKYSDLDIKYIGLDQDLTDQPISVISSYNSKGMEFDAVILVNVNAENFPMDELHARLLYVMLTRAQQEIKIFFRDIPSPLLEGIVEQVPETVSVYDDVF